MNKLTRRVIISTTEVDKEGYPAGKEVRPNSICKFGVPCFEWTYF